MQVVTNLLGPTKEHTFIASNFVYLSWEKNEHIKTEFQNMLDLEEDEQSWLKATGNLTTKWFQTNDISQGCGMFLPLHINSSFLITNEQLSGCDIFIKNVCLHDVLFIVQARYDLLRRFEHLLDVYSNFELYKYWPLLKMVEDEFLKKL